MKNCPAVMENIIKSTVMMSSINPIVRIDAKELKSGS